MNSFQECKNTADLVPLYLPQQLYLKPTARINISIQLPNVKKLGKSISHMEIMVKLRELIKPEEFTTLKVNKTTIEFVRFEAEVGTKAKVEFVLSKLNNKMIKLKDFSDLMRVKAAKAKISTIVRKDWDEYFHNERLINPKNPGRADTIHLCKLPTKWFVPYHQSRDEDALPSEKILYRIFEKFGRINNVDIPICDPYRKKMKDHISGLQTTSFDKTDFFEGYVQFKDYMGFIKAMESLTDMKLVHKSEQGAFETSIIVDYDRTKHLSDGSIRRREIVRERLIKKNKEKEEKERREMEDRKKQEQVDRQKEHNKKIEKERRRRLREEKRKAKVLEKLKISGSDEMNEKIAREEKKLLKVQRKLEAIRLIEELFKRIKDKHNDGRRNHLIVNNDEKELRMFKNTSELAVLTQKEKLHNAIKGRVMLKSILCNKKSRSNSSSSESSLSLEDNVSRERKSQPINSVYDNQWFGFPYHLPQGILYPPPAVYHPLERTNYPGTSRGFNRRGRGNRGFRGGFRGKSNHHDSRDYHKSVSRFSYERYRRSRSSSYSSQSTRRSRSRRRSYTRSRSRSYSRDKSRSKKSRRRTKSRSLSRGRTPAAPRRKSYSRSESRDKSRKKSRSRSRETSRKDQRSRSKSWSSPNRNELDRVVSHTPDRAK